MKTNQSACFLFSLMIDAFKGRMMPAAMNREYVWVKHDVETLCDSILRNIPIGSFLLWQPGDKADLTKLSRARLASVEDFSLDSAMGLLLDGQNRLATLIWLSRLDESTELMGLSTRERMTWCSEERLVLDAETQRIIFVPASEAATGLRLPAWALTPSLTEEHGKRTKRLIMERYEQWKDQFDEASIDRFIDLHELACDAFKMARTTVTIIEDATVEEAREIFMRICRVGVQMSQEDFDRAVAWV
jgi:hypothetical protein